MKKQFEDALGDLLAEYAEEDAEVLISAMELQIMAIKEQHHEDDPDARDR